MTSAIDSDHKHFRDIIKGQLNKKIQDWIKRGKFVKLRAKGGRTTFSIDTIEIPHIVYGDGDSGVSRGPGKEGDVIKRDEPKEDSKAGDEEGEGFLVSVGMEYFLDELQKELRLPNVKPKQTKTYEDEKLKYIDISLSGPESLRHNRRTILEALKRQAASNDLNHMVYPPGSTDPIRLIQVINKDRRYRQYKKIQIPSTNAVIMFARDGSGSMSEEKCEIVSDIAWWIDVWLRRYYEKVERCYFWHDVEAKEVNEEEFYKLRSYGGTKCSSCLKLMAKQLEHRYTPEKWNIYCFYFTDGDNWDNDTPVFLETLTKEFPPNICNLFGVTQVLCDNGYENSIKYAVDEEVKEQMNNIRTVSVGSETGYSNLSDDDRNEAVKNAIKALLSEPNVAAEV